jgi:hypothetical protein
MYSYNIESETLFDMPDLLLPLKELSGESERVNATM